jgi:23S rRNA pseudouridine2605 synthase
MPAKRVLAPQVDSPKLHKVLAQAGMGSRLEMEQLILEGRISVNNEPAHVGQRIQFGDIVKVNGQPIRFRIDPPPARVIAYHKPVGEVVTLTIRKTAPRCSASCPSCSMASGSRWAAWT